MQVTLEAITPERAAEFLSKNTRNRHLDKGRVRDLAAAMIRGEWEQNGDTIVFNDSRLLDGQHRLAAIVASGTTQPILVVRGIDQSAQTTIDTGRKRTLSDVLTLQGERNGKVLAAVLRMVWCYEQNGVPFLSGGPGAPTNAQSLETLGRHPGVRGSIQAQARPQVGLPASLASGLHYLFATGNPEDADVFFTRLRTGEGLEAGDPVYALRDRFIRDLASTSSSLSKIVRVVFTIRAWNAWSEGESLSKLQFKPGGARPDQFPRIYGCAIVPLVDTSPAA